jgi:hypothetical protein
MVKIIKFILLGFFVLVFTCQCKGVVDNSNFKIVSVTRVDSIYSNAAGNRYIGWNKKDKENGVLIVLKSKRPMFRTIYSTDFSLGFESKSDIPRRRCLGISVGLKNSNDPKRCTWMLGGSISRSWITKDKRYFGLIFSAPKNLTKFTLYDSVPIIKNITINSK